MRLFLSIRDDNFKQSNVKSVLGDDFYIGNCWVASAYIQSITVFNYL